jgi:ubiquinone/menaquinone biosynthesis C-methylase UbiE
MGGILAEQPDPTVFQSVLDVGCGTGEWLIEAAKTYPTMTRLVGVDISSKMLNYARAQADAQQVSDRVQFLTMDALRVLEFPDNSFDLVNQRFGFSYLRTWDWPKILSEYLRVTRSGGVIRITEPDILAEGGSSSALFRLAQIQLQAFHQAGYFATPDGDAVINELTHLLHHYGLQNVQTREHMTEYRAGTVQGQRFYEDMKYLFKTAVPFYRKWTHVPDDYETIYQQMLNEIQQPDFVGIVKMRTVWGTKRG